ncbi:MAG TPA: hypothetical protein VMU24_01480 [Candidatus Acidoferrales bacterium]|nr:hypothetical protein [Candidatus Acidoferrales bacterium]
MRVLLELVVAGFEFWLNTGGYTQPFSYARMLRHSAYPAGVPQNQLLVLDMAGRVLLGLSGFVIGASWMWLKSGQEPD